MRKIKEGETAEIKLAWVIGHDFAVPHLIVDQEEVAVPHNTIFRAAINGKELLFTYIVLLDPNERIEAAAILMELFTSPGYFGLSKLSRFDKDQVVAVKIPRD